MSLSKRLVDVLARHGLSKHDSMYNAFNIMLVAEGVRNAFIPESELPGDIKSDGIILNKLRLHGAIANACDKCGKVVQIVPITHEGDPTILVCHENKTLDNEHAILGRVLDYNCQYQFGNYSVPADQVEFIVRMSNSSPIRVLSYWCSVGCVTKKALEKLDNIHTCLQRHFGKLHVELRVTKCVDP